MNWLVELVAVLIVELAEALGASVPAPPPERPAVVEPVDPAPADERQADAP